MVKGYDTYSTLNKGGQGSYDQIVQQLMSMLQGGAGNIQGNPLYQSGSSYLQNILSNDPEAMKAFEAPHLRQFNEQTVPGLANLFGGLGAQSSSGFQQALGQAGAGLQENLARVRGELQQGAAGQALQYAQQPAANALGFGNLALNTQTQALMPKEKPFWQQLISQLTQGAGQGIGAAGSAAGGGILSALSNLFKPSQGGQSQQSPASQYSGGGVPLYQRRTTGAYLG
jgi:hypothetical protein